jgi:hypothetical protein
MIVADFSRIVQVPVLALQRSSKGKPYLSARLPNMLAAMKAVLVNRRTAEDSKVCEAELGFHVLTLQP